jgi:hypothetical protein
VTESFYTIVFILKNQERCRTVNPNLKEMWGKIFEQQRRINLVNGQGQPMTQT